MDDKTKAALLPKIQRIMDGDYASEEECDNMIEEVERHFSDPLVLDYMVRSNFTRAEEVIEKSLLYKPICLPDLSGPAKGN